MSSLYLFIYLFSIFIHFFVFFFLQPQNLLITSSFPHCDIKLCDFGISRVIENGIELREILGTPDYVGEWLLSLYSSYNTDISLNM